MAGLMRTFEPGTRCPSEPIKTSNHCRRLDHSSARYDMRSGREQITKPHETYYGPLVPVTVRPRCERLHTMRSDIDLRSGLWSKSMGEEMFGRKTRYQ